MNPVLPAVASCKGCPFWASDFTPLVIPTSFLFASTESILPRKGGLFAPFHRWGPERVENGNSECLHYTITVLTSGTRNTLTQQRGSAPSEKYWSFHLAAPCLSAREQGWPKRRGSVHGTGTASTLWEAGTSPLLTDEVQQWRASRTPQSYVKAGLHLQGALSPTTVPQFASKSGRKCSRQMRAKS